MKIIVTGATGFLGKRIAFRLKELGHHVVGLGRNHEAGKVLTDALISFVNVDLTHKDETIAALNGAEWVVHSAGLSSVWGAPLAFQSANVTAVENILEGCFHNGVKRIVHISTPSLYFDFQHKFNITESDPLPQTFVNHYAASKKRGEELVQKAAENDLETVILRPRGIFGPGDTSIFPRILSAMKRNNLPLIDEGKALMDITYVDNVVDAVVLALNTDRAKGQVYNITNDQPLTFKELLRLLSDKLNIPLNTKNISFNKAYYSALAIEWLFRVLRLKSEPPITSYGVGLVSKSMTFDITKAKQELNYKPNISIEQGFDFFAKWWNSSC